MMNTLQHIKNIFTFKFICRLYRKCHRTIWHWKDNNKVYSKWRFEHNSGVWHPGLPLLSPSLCFRLKAVKSMRFWWKSKSLWNLCSSSLSRLLSHTDSSSRTYCRNSEYLTNAGRFPNKNGVILPRLKIYLNKKWRIVSHLFIFKMWLAS